MIKAHTPMTLQKQILERIKTQGVKPVPKTFFKIRDYVLWILLGLFFVALSIGFAMIVFMFRSADLSLFAKLGFSIPERIMYSIPYFWILSTLAVLGIAYINFRNTRRGYKMSIKQFAVIAFLVAIALGSIAYVFNIARFVDRAAAAKIPLYNSVVPFNTNLWLDPEHGLLSGTVREKESDSDFMLRDANAVLWHVTGIVISKPDGFTFSVGDRIKLIGKAGTDDTFSAIEIIPWTE